MKKLIDKMKLPSLLILIALMTGCASIPGVEAVSENFGSNQDADRNKIEDRWRSKTKPKTVIKSEKIITKAAPMKIPDRILSEYIEVEFSDNAKLSDIRPIFTQLDLFLSFPDKDLREMPIVLFDYKGTVKNFLETLSNAYGISFGWGAGNVVNVYKKGLYIMKVPNNKLLVTEISETITSLGAEEVKSSFFAGTIHYKASSNDQVLIESMIKSMSINASMVSLQIGVVDVTTARDKKEGFDWSKLAISMGGITIGNTDGGSSGVSLQNFSEIQAAGEITSGAIAGRIAKSDFSMAGVVNFLSTYGKTTTEQSVLLATLSGKPVTIDSGEKVPYVSDVGVSTTGNSDSNSDSLLGSANIEEASTGLKVELTPYYDGYTDTVTIDIKLSLNTLLGFIELSAGNQIGTITRPRLQNKEMTSLVKVKVGEAIIVGGITYESKSDNRTNPGFLDGMKIASLNRNVSQTSTFVIIRPTVTTFRFRED